jgi:hypothetical protein
VIRLRPRAELYVAKTASSSPVFVIASDNNIDSAAAPHITQHAKYEVAE